MGRWLHDHYFREAKREGYLSRAAYKLIEIDDRKKLLGKGDCVLDCGAAPGSWLQVAARRVGPRGIVVGVDLVSITHAFPDYGSCIRCVEGEFGELPAETLLAAAAGPGGSPARRFDVILSDMAPNTSGDHNIDHHHSVRLCESVLDRCGELLAPDGRLAMKVFEGVTYPDLLKRARRLFATAKGFKPKASRHGSTEIYIVAHGYLGPGAEPSRDAPQEPRPRRPSPGWST